MKKIISFLMIMGLSFSLLQAVENKKEEISRDNSFDMFQCLVEANNNTSLVGACIAHCRAETLRVERDKKYNKR